MPYIPQVDRKRVDESGDAVDIGELTYLLTRTALRYLDRCGARFQTFAEVLGALSATEHELYRRQIAPYEHGKCEMNGDVY